jgi:hypothetical protein
MDDSSHGSTPCDQTSDTSTTPASAGVRTTDLLLRVQHALRDTHLPELGQVEVEIRYNRIHLRGRVSSYYLKQSAQSAARRAEPSVLVINLLRVILPNGQNSRPAIDQQAPSPEASAHSND